MTRDGSVFGTAEVAVIIVNYGTANLALAAVASVLSRSSGSRTIAVHLVDNASHGDDARHLSAEIAARGWRDRVTLFRETVNHGFGGGNNVVLERLARQPNRPKYVFLLNPDALLENDAITILADFLDAHPKAAVAGARIEKPGGIPVTAAFRFPGLASTFADAISFGPISRLFAASRVPLEPDLTTGPVDWVAGAAMMARFDAMRDAGNFDLGYFLYYEEVDLMRALARRGSEVWYVAEARVTHFEGASTGVNSGEACRKRRPAYWYHSWQYYFRKNHGRLYALAAAAAWIIGAGVNRLVAGLRRRPPAAPLHFFGDFWAGACRPLIGLRAAHHE